MTIFRVISIKDNGKIKHAVVKGSPDKIKKGFSLSETKEDAVAVFNDERQALCYAKEQTILWTKTTIGQLTIYIDPIHFLDDRLEEFHVKTSYQPTGNSRPVIKTVGEFTEFKNAHLFFEALQNILEKEV